MGNSQIEKAQEALILRKYAFFESRQEHPFGKITILRKIEQNYDYLLVMNRTIAKEYEELVARQLYYISKLKVDLLLRMYIFPKTGSTPSESCRQQGEQKENEIRICMQYHNYSLEKHIHFLRKMNRSISIDEVYYILRSAVMLAAAYEEMKLHVVSFEINSKWIYITPRGTIKFLPFRCSSIKERDAACNCSLNWQNDKVRAADQPLMLSIFKRQSAIVDQIKSLAFEIGTAISENKLSKEYSAYAKIQGKLHRCKSLEEMIALLPMPSQDYITLNLNKVNIETELQALNAYTKYKSVMKTQTQTQNQTQTQSKSHKYHASNLDQTSEGMHLEILKRR